MKGTALDTSLLTYEQLFMSGNSYSAADRHDIEAKAAEMKQLLAEAQKKVSGLKNWFRIAAKAAE